MAIVFLLTFTLGDWIKGFLETFLAWFQLAVGVLFDKMHVANWLQSLVIDGIITGVGGILTFLPNIIILFIALAVLEE